MNDGRSATPESRVMSNAASTSARVWPFSRLASTTSLSDSTAETRNGQPVRANSGAAVAPLITRPGEFFKVAVSDGVTLDGWMIKPANFDSTRVYPLLMYVYGEPAGQTAVDSWSGGHLWEHMIADQGYVVATVDNRGTPAPRGPSPHRAAISTPRASRSWAGAAADRAPYRPCFVTPTSTRSGCRWRPCRTSASTTRFIRSATWVSCRTRPTARATSVPLRSTRPRGSTDSC